MIWKRLLKKVQPDEKPEVLQPGRLSVWLVRKLERTESRLSVRQRFAMPALFLVSGSFCCVMLVIRPFQKSAFRTHIKIGSKTVITPLPAYQEDTRSIEWLLENNRYLDSLKRDSAGIHIYKRMRAMRPGLIDSIEYAGRLFNDKN